MFQVPGSALGGLDVHAVHFFGLASGLILGKGCGVLTFFRSVN